MEKVVLVHGHSCKHPEEYYSGLKEKLSHDYDVFIFSYNFRDSVQDIAKSLDKFLTENDIRECSFVGHSLGNVVIRYFLGKYDYNCGKFVAIFPPFNGASLINFIPTQWVREKIMGRATAQLLDKQIIFSLSDKTKLGIITGDKQIAGSWKYKIQRSLLQPFLGFRNNDGLLKVNETMPTDLLYKHFLIHENHMDLPDSPEMVGQILNFLNEGDFKIN